MCIYSDRYYKLINHYKQNLTEGFVEKHHVIPKCMGGSDDISNLVLLPVKAHFICHYLLHKMHPNNKSLAHAFAMMGVNNKHQNRKQTGKLYEASKIARSRALKGISRPEWVKEKLRKPKSSNVNYMGNTNAKGNKGKKYSPRTKEHMEKISNSLQWYYKQKRQETEERNIALLAKYIDEYKESDLSQRAFAAKYNLPRAIFYGVSRNKV